MLHNIHYISDRPHYHMTLCGHFLIVYVRTTLYFGLYLYDTLGKPCCPLYTLCILWASITIESCSSNPKSTPRNMYNMIQTRTPSVLFNCFRDESGNVYILVTTFYVCNHKTRKIFNRFDEIFTNVFLKFS